MMTGSIVRSLYEKFRDEQQRKELLFLVYNDKRFRFIVAGILNMIFGYTVSLFVYAMFKKSIGTVGIGVIINIINISFSFITYKFFVFKTKNNWIAEYFRCYIVYGFSAILGVVFLALFVDYLKIEFWIASGLVIIMTPVVSYIGHSRFSFR